MTQLIDLHAHSTKSDGLDTPTELVRFAAEAGVATLGITDHDTTDGWAEAFRAAESFGVDIVPGIELSTHSYTAAGRKISVHMLAYLPDPSHPELRQAMSETKDGRVNRAKRMVELLAEDYPISWDDVIGAMEPGATIGRPALADALVRAGVVATRSNAFESILAKGSRYYISEYSLSTVDAIRLVRSAGGVPIMAHPLTDLSQDHDGSDLPLAEFEHLVEVGIAGWEVQHRLVPQVARNWLTDLAAKHGLIITGSSDYHGLLGKDNRLGENQTQPEMLERIVNQASGCEPFLVR